MKRTFKPGHSTYTCSDCGKLTRDTAGEEGMGMCRTCLDAAEAYNYVQDGEMTDAEFQAYLKKIGYQGKDFEVKG